MFSKVTLIVVSKGRFRDKCCVFGRPAHGLVGRHEDCLIEFPDADEFSDISRHHCELDIVPPMVRVRDVGSRNGTFINGELIGQRAEAVEPSDVNRDVFDYRELKDGDSLCLGSTLLKVKIGSSPECPAYELQPEGTGSATAGTVAQGSDTVSDLGAPAKAPPVERLTANDDATRLSVPTHPT